MVTAPPLRRSGPPTPGKAAADTTTMHPQHNAAGDTFAVCDCGPCSRCRTPEPPLTEKHLDAWRATILHLRAAGYPAAVPAAPLAALCARGGLDRTVAHHAEAVNA